MSNLKDLTWEHHKNAERQEFVKEMFGGNISNERYATYLFNQHPQYNMLEMLAMMHGIFDEMTDLRRAPRIYEDYQELWKEEFNSPPLLPVVKEYMDYLMSIKDDADKLMAHVYVRHMGDLSGGQMIAKRVPGKGLFYKFERPAEELKELIRAKLNDSMADEAKLCFDFATKMFMQLGEAKEA
jgi:heme oxygenase|tara:strand:- start:332 stop:880 length:549 start_codon:yes stop_codon:yes gene_type:complete